MALGCCSNSVRCRPFLLQLRVCCVQDVRGTQREHRDFMGSTWAVSPTHSLTHSLTHSQVSRVSFPTINTTPPCYRFPYKHTSDRNNVFLRSYLFHFDAEDFRSLSCAPLEKSLWQYYWRLSVLWEGCYLGLRCLPPPVHPAGWWLKWHTHKNSQPN